MKILVTGGAGYIGSHTCLSLIEKGYEVAIMDNFINSSPIAIERLEFLSGEKIRVFETDITNECDVNDVFDSLNIDAVVHFAALKSVGESATQPIDYYKNNVSGTVNIVSAMERNNVNCILFSSSATVYGAEGTPPYHESMGMGTPLSPYGSTKIACERLIREHCIASKQFKAVSLRYFNPIGAHESGLIGEAPVGVPNNLMPYLTQVAVGRVKELTVFGNDYDTADGSCERDYLHVLDLADGHIAALFWALNNATFNDFEVFNLGTNKSTSVLEFIKAFEATSGAKVPTRIGPRRDGDLAAFWADATKAKEVLNWEAKRTLTDMMSDSWRWQQKNPLGYAEFDG